MPRPPLKLAVLVSGSGTTLQNLIDRIADGSLAAEISIVVGSRPGLVGLQRAEAAGLPFIALDRRGFESVTAFSWAVFDAARNAGVELICLAGWLCLLEIPVDFQNRVMNIHPSLLPCFGGKGMHGLKVHQAVLDHGCRVTGCTVHFVDDVYDGGPIILQRTCEVLDDDTPSSLAARVFEQEKIAYPAAVELFARGRLEIEHRRVRIAGQQSSNVP